MALETTSCFRVSTIVTTPAAAAATVTRFRALHAFNLPTSCKGLIRRTTTSALSSSSSPLPLPSVIPHATGRRRGGRGGRLVCEAKSAAIDEVVVATDANWGSVVVGSKVPVLAEFWAPWCGPCRMIAPTIKELAKEYAGKIVCCTVNTDDCPNIAGQYGIRSIPTVLLFNNGEKKESVIGAVPKSTLVSTIEKYVGL